MELENLKKTKAEREAALEEATIEMDSGKMGELEKDIADLNDKIKRIESMSETDGDPTEHQIKQIEDLGGNPHDLAEELNVKSEEIKNTKETVDHNDEETSKDERLEKGLSAEQFQFKKDYSENIRRAFDILGTNKGFFNEKVRTGGTDAISGRLEDGYRLLNDLDNKESFEPDSMEQAGLILGELLAATKEKGLFGGPDKGAKMALMDHLVRLREMVKNPLATPEMQGSAANQFQSAINKYA